MSINGCGRRGAQRYKGVLVGLALLVFISPVWFSLGDHTFNGRSSARYAVVAQEMANTGDWVVPQFLGQVHLTKPPMVYWLEAGSIELFGQTLIAVRLPSAIAGTLSVLMLFWFARRVGSDRIALVASGVYSIMPMTIFPARMTVTDSVVNLCWMSILWAGYLFRHHPTQRRWLVLFTLASGIGMLAKGPVLLIPVGLVWVWWIITDPSMRRASRIALVSVMVLLAMLPVLIWAQQVIRVEPEALAIWKHETIDRANGSGDHSRPFWFFVPVLLAGCFPASAMLILPGLNLRWNQAIGSLRSGGLGGFLGWAIIAPFVLYSLMSGKLTSYLLPICAPLALLCALMLEEWFEHEHPDPGHGRRMPEVRLGLLIGTSLSIVAIVVGMSWFYGPEHSLWAVALVPAWVAALWLVWRWRQQSMRVIGIGVFIGAWVLGWLILEELVDVALSEMSYLSIAAQTFPPSGWMGQVAAYQLDDAIIYWDTSGQVTRFQTLDALIEGVRMLKEPLLVLTTAQGWDSIAESNPQFFESGSIKARWSPFPGADERYLVVFEP